MAIHPEESPAHQQSASAIDVEAWTEQAVQAMSAVTISNVSGAVRSTSATFDIPLDDVEQPRGERLASAETAAARSPYKRHEPLRRDSLKRREALLKGKEGSRRRQRWENDRLLNNPWAQPPLPSDWEVRPSYPVQKVPYFLAPLWDAGIAARYAAKKEKAHQAMKNRNGEEADRAKVPKELKDKLKKSKGAKSLLQELESEVRTFVEKWEAKQQRLEKEGLVEPDSEDDEIVFVGRNGQMHDRQSPRTSEELTREKLLFHSPADDRSASFGRWLVHHLGTYYGLKTWSVTVGNPARREAYVGIATQPGRPSTSSKSPMPRPLWGLV